MNATPSRCAVVGRPIAHSRSPQIHALFAQQTGVPLTYDRLSPEDDDFEDTVRTFFDGGGRGMNITVPFKERAFRMAHAGLSRRAREAGAVNTLWTEAGQIQGCNTDGVGLLGDLTRLGAWHERVNVLLVGAGGAARGVLGPLRAATRGDIRVVNRSVARAAALGAQFSEGPGAPVTAGALADAARPGGWDIVVNATSTGLTGQAPELPSGLYAPGAWAYDMVYGRDDTPFISQARVDGAAHSADGLGMLVGQAAESFLIWHGKRPDIEPVYDALRAMLSEPS